MPNKDQYARIDDPITLVKWNDGYDNILTIEKLPITDVHMVCEYCNVPGYRDVLGYFYGSRDAYEFFNEMKAQREEE